MKTKVPTSGYFEVLGNASGRIGDYSLVSAVFVGVYQRSSQSIKRASIYTMIDEENRWNAPNPKFTAAGGKSPEVLHHLRHIFYKHKTGNQKRIVFTGESGNTLILSLSDDGDIVVGTEGVDFESTEVVSFNEDQLIYQDLLRLNKLINEENLKDPTRNPFRSQTIRDRLRLISMFT
jgi:hypothetical protein